MSQPCSGPLSAPPDLVGPDYTISRYRDDLYKIVWHKSTAPRLARIDKSDDGGYKHLDKLSPAISRARRVCLELALCNEWKWFATFTIAKDNYDRKNLSGFYQRFSEWYKYKRKTSGKRLPYLLVPEQHGDGSWHMHGFFTADIDEFLVPFRQLDAEGYLSPNGKPLPRNLIDNDYYNWPEYQDKFGFCSFGQIRNKDATAFYCTKYISKSFQGDTVKVGLKLYYCSQGLNRATYFDSVYGPCAELHRCLQNDYEFCATGFLRIDREPGDDPLLDILEAHRSQLFPMEFTPMELMDESFPDVVAYYECTQQCIAGFEEVPKHSQKDT